MIGYKMTRPDCGGWMFLGTTPEEVGKSIQSEIESNEGLDIEECGLLEIEAFEISQDAIDAMPDFPGW